MIDRALLVTELDAFARKIVTDYPVSDALHDLVDATVAILDLHGAGTTLAHDQALRFASASPSDVLVLEELQEETQSGPCVDAFRTGEPVLVADLTSAAARWPELQQEAARVGVRAVASVPLHLNGSRLGALDLYDARRREWTEEEVQTAELLAALATAYVANASRLDLLRQTTDQLQAALDSRVLIEQAKGLLAGERGISISEAFQVLRAHARSHNASLHEVANAVVNLGMRP